MLNSRRLLAAIVTCIFVICSSTNIPCPDHSTCEAGQTCCQLADGSYGCCDYPDGVCCSDKSHCCPRNHQCDLVKERCVPDESNSIDYEPEEISWKPKTTKNEHLNRLMALFYNTVPDKDQKHCSDCATDTSCCNTGCCPTPNGTCCPDGQHCCPYGTECEISSQTCISKVDLPNGFLLTESAALKITAKKNFETKSAFIIAQKPAIGETCPGGKGTCPNRSTCCLMASGMYGCCLYENATCCGDKVHCCPHNSKCDLEHFSCVQGEFNVFPMASKLKTTEEMSAPYLAPIVKHDMMALQAVNKNIDDVICPGGRERCPEGTTCCHTRSGGYGCCPFPNATCCKDEEHCCPEDTKCDLAQKKCVKGETNFDLAVTFSALEDVSDIVCPGGKSRCPDTATCCLLASGDYGCCPYPKAVCCSDKAHCCPHGTRCDVERQQCIKGIWGLGFEFAKTMPAKPIKSESVVCPGGKFKCPDETTCCQLASGDWGCCPYPNAVCCSDKEHCCPEGTQCDLEHSRCTQGNVIFQFAKVLQAKINSAEPLN